MKADVECRSLLLGLRQTVEALSACDGAEMRLNLTLNYNEAKLYLQAMLFRYSECEKPDVTARSVVPIRHISNDRDFIIDRDSIQEHQCISVVVGDISGFFQWVKKCPKDYEYITVTIEKERICFEQCNKNLDYDGGLVIVGDVVGLLVPCSPLDMHAALENAEYTDTVDGAKFLNTIETLNVTISDLSGLECPQKYIYFLNGKAKSTNGNIVFVCEDSAGIKNDLIIDGAYSACLTRMAKHCLAEFSNGHEYNEFLVKIGLINTTDSIIAFTGVNDAEEHIYGQMEFTKINLEDIRWHKKVTNNSQDECNLAAILPYKITLEKNFIQQAITNAVAIRSDIINLNIADGSISTASGKAQTTVASKKESINCRISRLFIFEVKHLKKLCGTKFERITIEFNNYEADSSVVRTSYDGSSFKALCEITK